MYRMISSSVLTLLGVLAMTSSSQAQVFVRAPFVRVFVGDPGVHVRAPFVNIFIPGEPPPMYYVPARPPIFVPPMPAPVPPGKPEAKPAQPQIEANAPAPVEQPKALTLNEFANSFRPQAGNYEITLVNPVNGTPTTVRFSLPEGAPRRVNVFRRELEFFYAPRQYVRIQFDQDGAIVTSR